MTSNERRHNPSTTGLSPREPRQAETPAHTWPRTPLVLTLLISMPPTRTKLGRAPDRQSPSATEGQAPLSKDDVASDALGAGNKNSRVCVPWPGPGAGPADCESAPIPDDSDSGGPGTNIIIIILLLLLLFN